MSQMSETLIIEKIVEGGMGLARAETGVVLVPGTLPGETVEAEIVEVKHGVARGRVLNIISPSPHRQPPNCPLFLNCGGCDFLHTPYSNELDLKQQILAETIERIGKIKPHLLPPMPAAKPEQYRAVVQLKIDSQGRIGLFRRESHDVVPFEGEGFTGCRLQQDRLNHAISALQSRLAGFQVIKFRIGDEGFVVNLTSVAAKEADEELQGRIRDIGATGFLVNDRLVFGSPAALYIYGEALGPKMRLRVSHDAFFQADPSVVQRLVTRLAEIISAERGTNRLNENMLDLYAGVGTFGVGLASKVLGVFCVEVGDTAARDLQFNITENHMRNCVAYRATAKSFLKRFREKVGAAIIDPPRTGIEQEVRRAILRLAPPLLLYVSCHPATLARDLSHFAADGAYHIDSVQLFDQFGRTHHIESLTVLKKI